jgi:hypothetical protein
MGEMAMMRKKEGRERRWNIVKLDVGSGKGLT